MERRGRSHEHDSFVLGTLRSYHVYGVAIPFPVFFVFFLKLNYLLVYIYIRIYKYTYTSWKSILHSNQVYRIETQEIIYLVQGKADI
jgi:hypothetical protein